MTSWKYYDTWRQIIDHDDFWRKFAKNIDEVKQEYNKLSPSNKQRADMEVRNIIVAQGLWGLWNYLQNVR